MGVYFFKNIKVVYLRTQKTGSTSIMHGLFKNENKPTIIWKGGTPLKKHTFPPNWKKYFSFAFVRNPYSRFISALNMFKHKTNIPKSFRNKLSVSFLLDLLESYDPNKKKKWSSLPTYLSHTTSLSSFLEFR